MKRSRCSTSMRRLTVACSTRLQCCWTTPCYGRRLLMLFQGTAGNNPDGKRVVVTVRRKISEPIDRLKLFQNAHKVPVMFRACHPADSRSLVVVLAYAKVWRCPAFGRKPQFRCPRSVKSGCINSCRHLDLASAMKNYDSARNMVEMCLHPAVMGLLTAAELKQNRRLHVRRWFIATTS